MPDNLSSSDPIRRYKRKASAELRVGANAHCACGEKRPEALIANTDPVICAECQRLKRGQTPMDDHHIVGRANSPETMRVPVNDHRARLSTAQYDWPRATLENPNGSPLLKAAACVRGACDMIVYIIETFLLWIADMLELLDRYLCEKSGQVWWAGTDLEQFAPKH